MILESVEKRLFSSLLFNQHADHVILARSSRDLQALINPSTAVSAILLLALFLQFLHLKKQTKINKWMNK